MKSRCSFKIYCLTLIVVFLLIAQEVQLVSSQDRTLIDSILRDKKKSRNLMPSRRKQLSHRQMTELSDKCKAYGQPCTFLEECCSSVCFKQTKTCFI